MSSIIFALELGMNFGHMTRCLALVRRCRAEGRQVFLVASDLRPVAKAMSAEEVFLVPAPFLPPAERGPRPANLAGLLLRRGYADREGLSSTVSGWLELFDLIRPEAIVCDYAPTALLAARVANVKAVVIGSGIEIPRHDTPLPSFIPGETPHSAHSAELDEALTASMNETLVKHGAKPLEVFADLFVDRPKFIIGFPELDPAGLHPNARYLGVSQAFPPMPEARWKKNKPIRALVYLHREMAERTEVLRSLERTGAEYLVLCSERAPEPMKIDDVLSSANIVVTHGSELTARSLAAGVPIISIPRTVEQYLVGLNVARIGAGLVMAEEVGAANLINRVLGDREFQENAREFSRRNQSKFNDHNAEAQWAAIAS